MKIQTSIISIFFALLLCGCLSSEDSKPSAVCITGKVVFTKDHDFSNIYIVDVNIGKQSVLYNDPTATDIYTAIGHPSWAPDGNSIAFLKYLGNNSDVYILTLDGSHPRQIANTPDIELSPSWSPDGKYILATSVTQLHFGKLLKIKADGSGLEQITSDDRNFGQASWSPDGKKIVYISGSRKDIGSLGVPIYIMNMDGSDQHTLTNTQFYGYMPKWSPDGKYISFDSGILSEQFQSRTVLYDIRNQTFSLLVPGDKGNPNGVGYSIGSAMWSKNGKCVMFFKDSKLYVMDFASRDMTELFNIGLTDSVDWYSE